MSPIDRTYFTERAVKSHQMAEAAHNPDVAAIHARLAAEYELLAVAPDARPLRRAARG